MTQRRAPAVTTVTLQTSGFLSLTLFFFSPLPFSLLLNLLLALHLCQSLPLSVSCHSCSLSSFTHTYTNTQTRLRLSCGNKPCACKSWLCVINQASQASSVSALHDVTEKGGVCVQMYVYVILWFKLACIHVFLCTEYKTVI